MLAARMASTGKRDLPRRRRLTAFHKCNTRKGGPCSIAPPVSLAMPRYGIHRQERAAGFVALLAPGHGQCKTVTP